MLNYGVEVVTTIVEDLVYTFMYEILYTRYIFFPNRRLTGTDVGAGDFPKVCRGAKELKRENPLFTCANNV